MRNTMHLKKILLLIVSLCFSASDAINASEDKIYVQLKDTAAMEHIRKADLEVEWDRIFVYSPRFEERHVKNGLHLWYKTKKIHNTERMARLLDEIRKMPMVEQAFMPHYLDEAQQKDALYLDYQPSRAMTAMPVNDPLYKFQWNFHGQGTPAPANINLEKAWQTEKGSRDVIVAVLDKPFDPEHEDYKKNVWVNEAELNGTEGIDDDGNGYTDDVYGFDMGSGIGAHGTHVAGIIAAVNDNGIGGCGIAGGDSPSNGVRIMRCDVPLGKYAIESCARALVYAADHGAVIAQNSYSVISSPLVTFAINYFMKNAGCCEGSPMKGGLVVWAAGNDNVSECCQPIDDPMINHDNLIVVSSVGPAGDKASYSNYGEWVDVAAPGGEYGSPSILSTLPGNKYGFMQGTSMACPHISGIAALVVSKFKGRILPVEVKHRIMTAVKDADRYIEGKDCWRLMGSGIADACKALSDYEERALEPVTSLWTGKTSSEFVELCWKLPASADGCTDADSCIIYRGSMPYALPADAEERTAVPVAGYTSEDTLRHHFADLSADSACYFRIQLKDRWGNVSELSETVSATSRQARPVIYGDYIFNRFSIYLPSNNQHAAHAINLNYKVIVPPSMHPVFSISDEGKALSMLPFKDGRMQLQLDAAGRAPGIYRARVAVADSLRPSLADSLSIVYEVRGGLPVSDALMPLHEGVSLNFVVHEKIGSLELNLNDCVDDPLNLGLHFEYDPVNNSEADDMFSGVHAELKDSIMHIDYEFVDPGDGWSDMIDLLEVPFDVSAKLIYGNVRYTITIKYEETTGIVNVVSGGSGDAGGLKKRTDAVSASDIVQISIFTLGGTLVSQHRAPWSDFKMPHLQRGCYLLHIATKDEIIVRKINIAADKAFAL